MTQFDEKYKVWQSSILYIGSRKGKKCLFSFVCICVDATGFFIYSFAPTSCLFPAQFFFQGINNLQVLQWMMIWVSFAPIAETEKYIY